LTSPLPSVRLSFVSNVSTRLPLEEFCEILFVALLRKSVQNFHVWLKSDKIVAHFCVRYIIVDSSAKQFTMNSLLHLNDNSVRFCIVDNYSRSITITKHMVAFLSCFLQSHCPRVFYLYFLFLHPHYCFVRCFIYLWGCKFLPETETFLWTRTSPCFLYPLTQIEPPYCANPCVLPAVKSSCILCHMSTVGRDFKIIFCSPP
jgi:hypothetical protein